MICPVTGYDLLSRFTALVLAIVSYFMCPHDLFLQAQSHFVTRFYKTDPNHTSGKIKLTPPVDSYTIVLVVLTLKLLKDSFNRRLFWVPWRAQMAVSGLLKGLAWKESVVYWWMVLAKLARHFSVDFATYQPLRSQHSPVILCLDSNCGLPPL